MSSVPGIRESIQNNGIETCHQLVKNVPVNKTELALKLIASAAFAFYWVPYASKENLLDRNTTSRLVIRTCLFALPLVIAFLKKKK